MNTLENCIEHISKNCSEHFSKTVVKTVLNILVKL